MVDENRYNPALFCFTKNKLLRCLMHALNGIFYTGRTEWSDVLRIVIIILSRFGEME